MSESEDGRAHSRKLDSIIIGLIIAVSVVLGLCLHYSLPNLERHEFIAMGTFYINDCGESHGGFEYAGTFYANLTWTDSDWILSLSLRTGLGDPLPYHELRVFSNFYSDSDMILSTEKGQIVLEYMAVDQIWGGMLNGTFVAIYSPSGPASENIGSISAEMFGLPAHYYVQLSLVPFPLGA